jgi:hypothetical protein
MNERHDDGAVAGADQGSADEAAPASHEPDDHAHGGASLGPIDWVAWAAGAVGVAIGLAMAAILASVGGAI